VHELPGQALAGVPVRIVVLNGLVRTTLAGGAMVLVAVLWNILGGRERLADVLADQPETV
jgi:hypothetical protein